MSIFSDNIKLSQLGNTYLFFAGQTGFIIKSKSGQLFGYDLCLSDCVERLEGHVGFKRLLPIPFFPNELTFDCLVSTHPHYDHFDVDSMPWFISNNHTKLFASIDCEKEVKRLGISNKRISYVKPNTFFNCSDFQLDFVDCDHGKGAPDAVGLVLTVDGKKIYFAGDTCFRKDIALSIASKYKIDVLIAPINGAFGNLNEEECAELTDIIKPCLTIPCHYGLFASHGGNVGLFYKIMTEKYPQNKFKLMAFEEKLILE
ncbi:MAG: MBL fold metallo-hydrolase [Candidatus Riflebacteria bacterium]|nr:MBL fold metallo-hydrolase [Candidatus Riflebacteria bacterium]